MPSIHIPKKSTATDMTPFVDIAFLILSFFMLATKFKPPQPLTIATPKSVSTDKLKEENSVFVEFDSSGKVFFTVNVKNPSYATEIKTKVIQNVNSFRNLGLTENHIKNFVASPIIGVPFKDLKAALDVNPAQRYSTVKATGIPTDSANNELQDWVKAAKIVFIQKKEDLKNSGDDKAFKQFETLYMIKGDNDAKYPQFDGVIEAMRRNDQFRFKLVTDPEAAPTGTELYRTRSGQTPVPKPSQNKFNFLIMSDIDVSSEGGSHKKGVGVKKAKKLSTRVDMTPMVDLGFLLITFFIFTTTLSTPSTMALNMPKKVEDEKQQMEIKASNALSILFGREKAKDDLRTVYFYTGQLEADGSNFQTATMKDIRQTIIDKRKDVISRHVHDGTCDKAKEDAQKAGEKNWENACLDKDFVVVIKPSKDARYATTIDLLDEMTINGVKAYALVDIAPGENQLVEETERRNGLR